MPHLSKYRIKNSLSDRRGANSSLSKLFIKVCIQRERRRQTKKGLVYIKFRGDGIDGFGKEEKRSL